VCEASDEVRCQHAVMHPGHIVASVEVEGRGGGLVTHELSRHVGHRPGLPSALLTNALPGVLPPTEHLHIPHCSTFGLGAMDRRFSRNCTSSSSSRTSPDSLLERDVLDAEHLGSLGAVKGVHVLEALVVGVELADGDVGRVGEALVQDLSTCQSVTRAGARLREDSHRSSLVRQRGPGW
jgi:hypothetical protein